MKSELQLMSLLMSSDSRRPDNSWLFLVVPGINSTARMRAQAGCGLRLMIAQAGDSSAWMWALTVCVLRLDVGSGWTGSEACETAPAWQAVIFGKGRVMFSSLFWKAMAWIII